MRIWPFTGTVAGAAPADATEDVVHSWSPPEPEAKEEPQAPPEPTFDGRFLRWDVSLLTGGDTRFEEIDLVEIAAIEQSQYQYHVNYVIQGLEQSLIAPDFEKIVTFWKQAKKQSPSNR